MGVPCSNSTCSAWFYTLARASFTSPSLSHFPERQGLHCKQGSPWKNAGGLKCLTSHKWRDLCETPSSETHKLFSMQAEQAKSVPSGSPESPALLHSLPSSTALFTLFYFFLYAAIKCIDGRALNSHLLKNSQPKEIQTKLSSPQKKKRSEAKFFPSYTGKKLTEGQDILMFSAITKFGSTQKY